MPALRYRSPDDPAFVVFDQSRFRVDHGIFYLRVAPLRARIGAILGARAGWNLEAMKLVQEDRRLRACLEWLESTGEDGDEPLVPELVHEPAIDLVADGLIGDREFDRADCPTCLASYTPDEVESEPWEFEEEGVTVRGRRTLCGKGHAIHALRDLIDDPSIEIEVEGD